MESKIKCILLALTLILALIICVITIFIMFSESESTISKTSSTTRSSTIWTSLTTMGPSKVAPASIIVIGGIASDKIEIIDYDNMTACEIITNYPFYGFAGFGGLNQNNEPEYCGGGYTSTFCWDFSNGYWESSNSLTSQRYYSAGKFSPYKNSTYYAFAVGGLYSNIGINSTEVLTENGWSDNYPQFPTKLYQSCLTMLNDSTIFIVGGNTGDEFSKSTYLLGLNDPNPSWKKGPNLFEERSLHACGRVKTTKDGNQYSILAAGGYYGYTPVSTEFFSINPLKKSVFGSDLPWKVVGGASVEDPYGGFLIVGGDDVASKNILRLQSANANWEILKIELITPTSYAVAFFIPNNIINCN